jgi:hypothetical protein
LKPLWSRLLLCDHEPSQPMFRIQHFIHHRSVPGEFEYFRSKNRGPLW